MNEAKDFTRIPAGACTLVVGEFELGDNGEGAKSAPVRLVARSGKAIEHWYWGNVVHDLAGMRLHKSRLPIDYVHDSKEIIGYLNRFDTSSGDLVTTGALVPYKDGDRATEILHKMKAGVPYEASINFGGDGIKVEEVFAGQTVEVNGAQFVGPGVIVREFPLRGVAICPYGADANTSSNALSESKTYTAAVVTPAPEAPTKETVMSNDAPVEVAAQAETPAAAEPVKNETNLESAPVEAPAVEATPEVPAQAVEAAQPEGSGETEVKPELPAELSRAEFLKIVDEFGAEVAAQTVRDGGGYHAAQARAYAALKAKNAELEARLSQECASVGGTPAKVVAAPANPNKGKLFKTGK
jgi:hypothetical protein